MFLVFFGWAWGMWKLPGQGLKPHHCNPSCYSANAGSLTHCVTRELPIDWMFKWYCGIRDGLDPLWWSDVLKNMCWVTLNYNQRNVCPDFSDSGLSEGHDYPVCPLEWSAVEWKSLYWHFLNLFLLFRGTPVAYGSYQTRGQITAVAACLYQSGSNTVCKLCLQPTPLQIYSCDKISK